MSTDTTPAGLLLLQQEVPENLIGHLPRVTCRGCKDNRCDNQSHRKVRCQKCGGFLTTAHIDLDYVGHAETTAQLLKADPGWTWEPLAFGEDGLPKFDSLGGLWIKLTVCGVTRLGYGTADSGGFKAKGDVVKELIGDALRNAAMRFGWALNLWAKTDIHDRTEQEEPPGQPQYAVADAVARKEQMSRTRPSAPVDDEFTIPQPQAEQQPARSIIDEPSEKQMKMLHALLNKKFGQMHDGDRYVYLSNQVGHAITSAKDLTKRDVSKLIDELQAGKAPAPYPDDGQDFHLPSDIGPAGICSGLIDAMAAAPDMAGLTALGKRVADLKGKGILHEEHLGRLDAAWRARQEELAVAA
jgi:ribosomal protein S27E